MSSAVPPDLTQPKGTIPFICYRATRFARFASAGIHVLRVSRQACCVHLGLGAPLVAARRSDDCWGLWGGGQRYLTNPHLIDGFKYDLRVYVVVTCFDPLRVYVYPDGLARFATEKYSSSESTLRKRCMHLTNYSINSKKSQFELNMDKEEDGVGSKWSLAALQTWFRNNNLDWAPVWQQVRPPQQAWRLVAGLTGSGHALWTARVGDRCLRVLVRCATQHGRSSTQALSLGLDLT